MRCLPLSLLLALLFVPVVSGQTVPADSAEPRSAVETPISARLTMEHFTLAKPGSDERCQATIVRRGPKLLLVVWTDGHGGGGHTGRPEKYGWHYAVTSRDAQRRAVSWETRFLQDQFTKVTFRDGDVFLPRDGHVILLRTRGPKREVEQLKIDLADYAADERGLTKLAQHEGVKKFFASGR